jgi:hypothetical protein
MRVTLSDRTILVNLLAPMRRKQVKAFSYYAKIPMLLVLSMSGEKFRDYISSCKLPLQRTLRWVRPIDRGRILNYLKPYSIELKECVFVGISLKYLFKNQASHGTNSRL